MELQQLIYFVATAEELHFKRAAARLDIAQPSLTEQIRRLEDALSVRLFDRNSHRVALTAAGTAFLERSRRILRSADRAAEGARWEERVATRACEHAGRLRVGYVCAARHLVPRGLRAVRAAHPGTALAVREDWSRRQIDDLLGEEIDVGFVLGTDPDPRLVLRPVLTTGLTVLLPPGHPLATRSGVTLGDLRESALVLFARDLSPVLHDRLAALAADAGVPLDVRHTVTDAAAALLLVRSGHGVALVTRARAAEAVSPEITQRPLVGPAGPFDLAGPVCLVWRRGDRARPLRAFVGGVGVADGIDETDGVTDEEPAWNCAS